MTTPDQGNPLENSGREMDPEKEKWNEENGKIQALLFPIKMKVLDICKISGFSRLEKMTDALAERLGLNQEERERYSIYQLLRGSTPDFEKSPLVDTKNKDFQKFIEGELAELLKQADKWQAESEEIRELINEIFKAKEFKNVIEREEYRVVLFEIILNSWVRSDKSIRRELGLSDEELEKKPDLVDEKIRENMGFIVERMKRYAAFHVLISSSLDFGACPNVDIVFEGYESGFIRKKLEEELEKIKGEKK